MPIVSGLKERLFGPEEAQERRYNCRACSSRFSMPESTTHVSCPECGETERVYRL